MVSWKNPRSWRSKDEKSSSRIRRLILDMVKRKKPPRQPADRELGAGEGGGQKERRGREEIGEVDKRQTEKGGEDA